MMMLSRAPVITVNTAVTGGHDASAPSIIKNGGDTIVTTYADVMDARC